MVYLSGLFIMFPDWGVPSTLAHWKRLSQLDMPYMSWDFACWLRKMGIRKIAINSILFMVIGFLRIYRIR
jgi:hypothetical protein